MGGKHIEISDSKKRARSRTISQFFFKPKSQTSVPQESIQTQKKHPQVEVANTEEHDKTRFDGNEGGFSIEDAIDIDGDDCCDDNDQHKSDLRIKKDSELVKSPAEKDAGIPQNPFANFAFSGSGVPEEKNTRAAVDGTLSLSTPPPSRNPSMRSNTTSPALNKNRSNHNNIRKRAKQTSPEVCSFEDLPYEERQRCLTKWQSFADAKAPLEQRRFQVLVAARLHAQAQEPVIREAMKSLRAALAEDPKCHTMEDKIASFPLSVDGLARADPEKLAQVISSVHFHNSKSRQIVKAAGEIKSRFGGIVPESKHGLVQITGIGPKLADILSRVNTRAAYNEGDEGNVDDNVNGIRFRGSTLQSMQKDSDTKSVGPQGLLHAFAAATPSSKKKRRKDPD